MTQPESNLPNQSCDQEAPEGFERREVIWPGTNELTSVLMPVPTRAYSLD